MVLLGCQPVPEGAGAWLIHSSRGLHITLVPRLGLLADTAFVLSTRLPPS